jgi:hypothetical protein
MGKLFHIDHESRATEAIAGKSAPPECQEKMVLARYLCIFFMLVPWKEASLPGSSALSPAAAGHPDATPYRYRRRRPRAHQGIA